MHRVGVTARLLHLTDRIRLAGPFTGSQHSSTSCHNRKDADEFIASNGTPILPGPAPLSAIIRGSPAQPQSPQSPTLPMSNGRPAQSLVERPATASTVQSSSVSSRETKTTPLTDTRNVVRRKLTGYVGFANLPNQYHRKSLRKGFNFNIMVVGTCSSPVG